jgi:hypothetical protein
MEHIGNYLDKYRHMIAEHDAQTQLFAVVDSLQVALTQQGEEIQRCKEACEEALAGLEAIEKQHEDNKH